MTAITFSLQTDGDQVRAWAGSWKVTVWVPYFLRFVGSTSLLLLLVLHTGCTVRITGTPTILDGDTIDVRGRRLRLHGFDAPETRQRCLDADGQPWACGEAATSALSAWVGEHPVVCRPLETDRYGRTIASCRVDGRDLGAFMVREGWAVAYRTYSLRYVRHERSARRAGRGIWAGELVMPWDWRRGARVEPFEPPPDAPAGCFIKGNINRRGDRIYHVPGGRWYEQVRIDPSQGERWFCDEHEARAAGWRRASQ